MATVNFSVPEAIKVRFNKVFEHENKSHLIAELMKKAIEDRERQQKRARAIEALLDAPNRLIKHVEKVDHNRYAKIN